MRPIDADEIPYTMLYKENWMKGTGEEAQGVWKSEIDRMPTIEPKRGKWIPNSPFTGNCSECSGNGNLKDNYCPNCGAKMD